MCLESGCRMVHHPTDCSFTIRGTNDSRFSATSVYPWLKIVKLWRSIKRVLPVPDSFFTSHFFFFFFFFLCVLSEPPKLPRLNDGVLFYNDVTMFNSLCTFCGNCGKGTFLCHFSLKLWKWHGGVMVSYDSQTTFGACEILFVNLFTSRVSGRGHRIGAVCVCVCVCLSVRTLTTELFDLWPW